MERPSDANRSGTQRSGAAFSAVLFFATAQHKKKSPTMTVALSAEQELSAEFGNARRNSPHMDAHTAFREQRA